MIASVQPEGLKQTWTGVLLSVSCVFLLYVEEQIRTLRKKKAVVVKTIFFIVSFILAAVSVKAGSFLTERWLYYYILDFFVTPTYQ